MKKLNIDMSGDSTAILDRVIEAYGFPTKIMLADHLGIASSSLAGRYKRGGFPADIVVRCMAETGATLEWLATGVGPKKEGEDFALLRVPRFKIVDGQLYEADILLIDHTTFLPGVTPPTDPICVIDGSDQRIIDRQFSEVYDGDWLIEVEGKTSVRNLTRIPVKKVKVIGPGVSFECSIEDIKILGRISLTIR